MLMKEVRGREINDDSVDKLTHLERDGWVKVHYFPVHCKDNGTRNEFDSFVLGHKLH